LNFGLLFVSHLTRKEKIMDSQVFASLRDVKINLRLYTFIQRFKRISCDSRFNKVFQFKKFIHSCF
jgi:hypothetical protein